TVATVVRDFQKVLPEAAVYVYDNNSTDRTAQVAASAGAAVRAEPLQGKGNVVRRMFGDIEAEIYLLVAGDGTYDGLRARELRGLRLSRQLDMVTAARVSEDDSAFRRGHRLGNRLLTALVAMVFGSRLTDMLSGYRAFSRRFVKSFPALSSGFEVETELTVHALELRMKIAEVETIYRSRREGSHSKLSTLRDGIRILSAIAKLIREERPLQSFSALFSALAVGSVALGWPIVIEYMQTGLVPRFPTAILATGVMLLAFLSLACGLILDTVTYGRQEMKRMWYLSQSRDAVERPGTGRHNAV